MASRTWVRPYWRSDGTRVRGHYRRRTRNVAVGVTATVAITFGVTAAWPSDVPARPSVAREAPHAKQGPRLSLDSADLTLGKVKLHFDFAQAAVTTTGDDNEDKQLTWKVRVSNKSG